MRRAELVEKRDMLLFDILEELKAIRADLSQLKLVNENISINEEISEQESLCEAEKPLLTCKHCGGEHARSIDIVNCGKRKKKKG
jgi:hypothetical protein